MGTPFAGNIDEHCWKALIAAGEMRSYRRGEVLFDSGMPAEGVYLIVTGNVRMTAASSNGKRKRLLGHAGPGSILALGQTMSEQPHKFTAQTAATAQICFVPRQPLLEMLLRTPGACMQVVQMLSNDLHRLYHALRVAHR